MKISCLPISYYQEILSGRMSVIDWAEIGASIGLDAIDLSIIFFADSSDGDLRKIRQKINSAGIFVKMLVTYPDFTNPNPDIRKKELTNTKNAVHKAELLGADLVRVTAGQAHPDTDRQPGIEWAVEGLYRLAEATHELDVTLVYENHAKPAIWEYTDFSQSQDIFLEIYQRTSEFNLGINFDTANATAFSDDPVKLLDMVIDRVVSIHASDTAVRNELKPVLLGSGVTPFLELFRILKNVGWDGWICIEEASFQGKKNVEAAAKFIYETWQDA